MPKYNHDYIECKGCQAAYCAYAAKIHEYCPCYKCLVKPSCKEACEKLLAIIHNYVDETVVFRKKLAMKR